VKKWLLKNQPQEGGGFLPLVQSSLETVPQLVTARALYVGATQSPLGTAFRIMHIHLTRLIGVKGWVESQVLWCNVHNVQVGDRMAKLVAL
jgi:hypothetical protein